MTTNALRAQELKHQRENDKARNDLERRKQDLGEKQSRRSDNTTKRGQNLRAASDAADFIGGMLNRRAQRGSNAFNTIVHALPTIASLNDWEWYARDEQTAKDIASLPWGQRTGMPLYNAKFADNVIPGVLTITTVPGVGVSTSGVSGMNVAARQIYSWVRHANSGSANYEAVDLMQYLISLGSLYAAWGNATRLLGLTQTAVATNAYMPKAILSALGADYSSYASDIANFRARLNNLSLRITRMFAAPKDMAFFKRMLMCYSHIYIDSASEQDQIYAYKPAGFYKYNEIGGGCVFYPTATFATPDDVIAVIENLLTVLTTSESANIMSGDIRKAYGEGNLWELPSMDETYEIALNHDPLVLDQMRNATIPIGTPTNLDITQNDNGDLVYQPHLSISGHTGASLEAVNSIMNALMGSRYLTTSVDNPTYKEVLDITRMAFYLGDELKTPDTGFEHSWPIRTCGLDFPVAMEITRLNGGTGAAITRSVSAWMPTTRSGNSVDDDSTKCASLLANFDYHPILYVNGVMNENGTKYLKFSYAQILGDIDRWTPLTFETLSHMNDSIMLNVFYVPNRQ